MARTGSSPFPGFKPTVGLAYIACPTDLERAAYLLDCYMNFQVSLVTEDGAWYNRVQISPEDLNWIVFPMDNKTFGSPVIYVTEDEKQQPYVMCRLSMRQELGDGKENQFKFRRKLNDQIVEINGSAADGVLNIIVDGAGKPGFFNISIFNQNQDCSLNVDVAGDIIATASGAIQFNQEDTFTATTTDPDSGDVSSFNQTATENQFKNEKFVINKGNDPLTLGNELKQLLSDFFDEVGRITTITALGLQPIVNKVQILAFKEKLDTILSQVAFIDK